MNFKIKDGNLFKIKEGNLVLTSENEVKEMQIFSLGEFYSYDFGGNVLTATHYIEDGVEVAVNCLNQNCSHASHGYAQRVENKSSTPILKGRIGRKIEYFFPKGKNDYRHLSDHDFTTKDFICSRCNGSGCIKCE